MRHTGTLHVPKLWASDQSLALGLGPLRAAGRVCVKAWGWAVTLGAGGRCVMWGALGVCWNRALALPKRR